MDLQGVCVQIEHPTLGVARGSGLKINNVVVTHSSFLVPLCLSNIDGNHEELFQQYKLLMSELQSMHLYHQLSYTGYLSTSNPLGIQFKVLSKPSPKHFLNTNNGKDHKINLRSACDENYTIEEAFPHMIFSYKELSSITEDISNWTYNDKDSDGLNHRLISVLLPKFIFLIVGELSEDYLKDTLTALYNIIRDVLVYPGLPIIVESTPFGNLSFANSWSLGIISKTLGCDDSGFLTDARLVPGCEGAPVYSLKGQKSKGPLIGLVIHTVSWCNGEWVGFSLGLSIKHFLKAVLGLQSTTDYIPFNKLQVDLPASEVNIAKLSASIVFVRCQHKWGSGVVIDDATGLILTCSHTINHALDSVSVLCEGGQFPARVVFASPPSAPYDVALISVRKVPGLKQLKLASDPPVIGERVVTAGYPLSTEALVSANFIPTLSAGNVAKVSPRGGPLQTTCCTHSGISGGALLRPPDQLLGIVVSNVLVDGTTLPSFGFAVSINNIKQPIVQYLNSRDPACLQPLSVESHAVKMEWSLLNCKL